MEKHIEMSVEKKLTLSERIFSFLMSVLPMLVGAYVLVLVFSMKLTGLMPLAVIFCALSVFASYKIFCCFNIDWEYIFIDDEIRFSKIVNKTRRKELVTVNLSKSEAIARVDDSAHNQYLKNSEYKKFNFKTNTTDECWFVAGVTQNGQRVCVIFEPGERMLEAIRLTVRSKFFG